MRRGGLTTLLVLAVLMLAACGGSDERDTAAAGEPRTRMFEHALGTTEIPVEPMRIVTMSDQNAMLPLLELGVKPVASAGRLQDDGTGTFRRVDGFDTSGIAFVGDFIEPNLEAIAAARPDLIVGDAVTVDEENYDLLSAIAPTVSVQVFDRPLTEALADFAELVGREDRAAELQAAYEERVAEVGEALGADVDRLTVSILAVNEPGTFYPESTSFQAQGTVMQALGLRRPAANTGSDSLGLETLSAQDADAVLVCDYGTDGRLDAGVEALVTSPLYTRLAATAAGQAEVLDCAQSVGSSWGKMDVFLGELERILLADGFDADVVQG